MAERYTINSTDITDYLTHLQIIDGNIGIPPLLQDDYVIPGRTGVVTATPWWGPRVVSFGGIVTGDTRADYQDNLRSLMNLVHQSGQTYTMQRRLDTLAGSAQTTQAVARYAGGLERVEQLSPSVGRVAFDVMLTEGYWYDTAVTTLGTVIAGTAASGTATFVAAGNAPTQKVDLTYSVGPQSQRLTNDQFPGVGRLTLIPGNNKVVLSGGGAVGIKYRAAWL